MKKLLFIALLLISCAPNIKYYPYKYDSKKNTDIRDILLCELNPIFGIPKELAGKEVIADSLIVDLLQTSGYKVNRSTSFSDLLKRHIQSSGGPYDHYTGRLRQDIINRILKRTAIEYCHIKNVEAVIIPFLIPRNVKMIGNYGYWDGMEEMLIVDSDYRIISNYNFSGECVGLSLKVIIINKAGDVIFQSIGGIELATKFILDGYTLKSASRDDHFEDIDKISKGIKTAFHPFIKNPNYPVKPNFISAKMHDSIPEARVDDSDDPSVKDYKDYERSFK